MTSRIIHENIMSNGISIRQNDESNITRLAAQRQLYRDAGGIEILNAVLTVIVPISFTIIQDISGHGKTLAGIISLIMLGVSFVFDNKQKTKKVLAATIQQEFDISVFAMDWDKRLYGERKNLNYEIADASKRIMSNEKKKASLKDWYRKEVDALPLEEGITACQKINFDWDAGLRKRYRRLLIIILSLIIGGQLVIGVAKAEPIQEFLLRIVAISSALKWIIKSIDGINNDLKRMESIERAVYSNEKKSMEDLAFIQKEIFENRKVVTKIPDWFYKIFKNNDEDRERRALEISRGEITT